MKATSLTARRFRMFLVIALLLIVGLGGAGFYFAQSMLVKYADATNELRSKAQSSNNDLRSLKQTQTDLEKQKTIVDRTEKIVAASQGYQYQDQIIQDILKYAKEAQISVTDFKFEEAAGTAGAAAAPLPAANGTTPTQVTSPGLKTTSTTVTIVSPVSYSSVLKFIKLIEQNLTKMQIANIAITKDSGGTGGPDAVTSQAFTIEVYTK